MRTIDCPECGNAIKDLIPTTFYSDRDLEFRLEMIVDQWKRAIAANHELEDKIQRIAQVCGGVL